MTQPAGVLRQVQWRVFPRRGRELAPRIFLVALRIFLVALRIFLVALCIFLVALRIFLVALRCFCSQISGFIKFSTNDALSHAGVSDCVCDRIFRLSLSATRRSKCR
jgi:hypothetical protein